MKRLVAVVITLFFLTGCFPLNKSPNLELHEMHIYGKVTDSVFHHPLSDVLITCQGQKMVTDRDGLYSFDIKTFLNSEIELTFSKDGYEKVVQRVRYEKELELNVQLGLKVVIGEITGNVYLTDFPIIENTSLTFPEPPDQKTAVINFFDYSRHFISHTEYTIDEYIVMVKPGKEEEVSKILQRKNLNFRYIAELDMYVVEGAKEEDLKKWLGFLVEAIEPNIRDIHLLAIPTDPDYFRQWHFPLVHFPDAWDQTRGDSSIVVAVIDSGVALDHPDLVHALVPGWDFVDNDDYPMDLYGHGTMVAGIIAAGMDNGVGGVGAAPEVKIMPIRAFDENGVSKLDWIIQAIEYAVEQGVDIINMSFGYSPTSVIDSKLLYQEVKKAVDAGIIMVAAAGNDSRAVNYPAAYEGVIAVGAVDYFGQKTGYSSYGPQLDLMAPGGTRDYGVYSTALVDGSYSYGTSFAAPHVSGLAALLLSSGLSPDEVYQRLINTATDLHLAGKDDMTGYGLINAYAALNYKTVSGIKVFLGELVNQMVELKSYITYTDGEGNYEINQIQPGDWHIMGWLDSNDNGLIDEGDYFGLGPIISFQKNSQNYYPTFKAVNFAICLISDFETLKLRE
ncbi:hypothetical protein BBF96_14190 [Anoxybacter fermentans]|uniref:Peptidase S8/S53 domain-containing protein n=1 Tax=Anoxybacter fermentans TaxID=1323375 RepID=A0A3S9T1K2_9FIRM|nr:S8 family serine peptidase [Anoxybacter fermentans]AZR74434.1 hypothetical protein BBF96_14190 [Anoxybacter fermentans]